MGIAFALLLGIFIFKNQLETLTSGMFREQQPKTARDSITDDLSKLYNYEKNGDPYEYTFLEFGSVGCSSCKKMEDVMKDIREKYGNKVKVVFINVAKKENQNLSQYFGISLIPTQILLNRTASEYFRHSGYISTEELEKVLFN